MKLLIFIICGYLAIFSSVSTAQVTSSEDYDYYYVYPHSVAEIATTLTNETPILENGEKFYGHAYSVLSWSFNWRYNSSSCWITAVNTDVHTTYTLPKLGAYEADVNAVWNQWYPRLQFHEKGHHNLALNIANDINRHILYMPRETGCAILEKKANALANQFISELGVLNTQYDLTTQHGDTEGASLSDYLPTVPVQNGFSIIVH